MGALHGLAAETGWDPATADLLVGRSAGAVVGALTLAGARPWDALRRPAVSARIEDLKDLDGEDRSALNV
jgi:NTE family protein